jgi:hypothetical protein
MDKLQIDKKLIIDLILIVLLLTGALMLMNEIPGGLLVVLFSSVIWSLLLLSGAFFLFKSKNYDSKVWSLIIGVLVFIVPISYSFRMLLYSGHELLTAYSVTVLPLLIILFTILLLAKRKTRLGRYYLNTLIRLVILLTMCFFY